ncbi:MAG: tRNA-intron lyase [Nitrososphaerota archaeon]|jgi:tRNA-intron endonuclease|nr:tRNA-intron lyase [Nitrososphaerota archaeon]MDG6937119.1 tRNA-intron lyase [Nitrososphaerota archaeon]MDG6969830.1 tRNA-intron lyase [Nitrososphaerota archaeon]MDG6972361.1 tRNA-intron lyase [Nitrososphaerota archaeon]MDG6980097.1 tRNA-intron lyase [Nitrososphaerota archaeon]
MPKARARGRLFENRIVVWDVEDSRRLFKEGYYGKPLGIPKPKDFEFDAPLILDLMEGYYLSTRKVIDVEDQAGKALTAKQLQGVCEASYPEFAEKFLVYRKLREGGYVVTPGIKFGSDFAVYEHGPGIDHAPYIVQVMPPGSKMTATAMVRSGRLATTVRKQFIIAIPDMERKSIEFLRYDWWRA